MEVNSKIQVIELKCNGHRYFDMVYATGMKNSVLVDKIHTKYTKKIGSEQIATKLALREILNYVEITRPDSILEIGSGIGTITNLLIKALPDSDIFCYELNSFCLKQLKKNVNSHNIIILNKLTQLQKIDHHIDFIIIDEIIDKRTTFELIKQTRPKSVFIEGHRRRQRLHVMLAYRQIGESFSFRNIRRSQDSHKGGCFIHLMHNSNHKELISLLYIRITIVFSKFLEVRSKISLRNFFVKHKY